MIFQKTISIRTRGRGTLEITDDINTLVRESGINRGVCNLFLMHTSASLILCENADPTVRHDLETIMHRLSPDGDPDYRHDTEGPDDMAAHARTVLTDSHVNVPVENGKCMLGTWQGIFLWEHRTHGHSRNLVITVFGEG